MKKAVLVIALIGSSVLAFPAARAQYCAPDDYSPSCVAQRQCEETRDRLGRLGEILISCTQ